MSWMRFELQAVVQMLVAVVLGAVVGLERARHGRPAGMRTHALVCAGATMIMLTARGLATVSPEAMARITVDPGRIAAGIITGIGFLGAGSIIKSGDFVRGLTTAACLWFVAALGIIIGEGFFLLSLLATALALFLLVVMDRFEHRFARVVYRSLRVVVPAQERRRVEDSLREVLAEMGMRVQDTQYRLSAQAGAAQIVFRLRGSTRTSGSELMERLLAVEGVRSVEWR
ncbi:MAG: MgtC/SapB family protein [candidate division KSB1 bacterium]|nr:MgtC/SapB family protein [candidate division KSB1 bacterium]MDZ7378099.1 MgtC/SapB family protein [candidate division KSB1 bacterium]MDZ7386004.1 MgtC/SapB family protein [candidate division KSB1 bacterium]MDZ7392237.1 MgtC/SapB family protein [candidate division KSB1 bacterium]